MIVLIFGYYTFQEGTGKRFFIFILKEYFYCEIKERIRSFYEDKGVRYSDCAENKENHMHLSLTDTITEADKEELLNGLRSYNRQYIDFLRSAAILPFMHATTVA